MARSTRATSKEPVRKQPVRKQPRRGRSADPEPTPAPAADGPAQNGKGKKGRGRPSLGPIVEEPASPGADPDENDDNNDNNDEEAAEQQVNLEELSPTLSTGPEFNAVDRPDPEAIRAAGEIVYLPEPRGFFNRKNEVCYRNSAIVMLLSSSKLMSWIEHRYIPNLHAGGVVVDSVIAKAVSKSGKKPKGVLYTDCWCELNILHGLWCDDDVSQKTLDDAMNAFWRWLKKEDKKAPNPWGDNFDGQQDAMDFVTWLFSLATAQLEHFAEVQENKKTQPALDSVQLSLLRSVRIDELVSIEQTNRSLCVVCGGLRGDETERSKFRFERPESTLDWKLSLSKSPEDRQPAAKSARPRSIEEIIEGEMKSLAHGSRCSTCYSEWEVMKDNAREEARKKGGNAAVDKVMKKILGDLETVLERKTTQWKRLRILPEVLIVQLKRFKVEQRVTRKGIEVSTLKDNTPVRINEYLDLGPWVEYRGKEEVAAAGSTRYRLTGIINHFGDLVGGHYVAEVRIDDTWYEANDMNVKTGPGLQSLLKDKGWTPYVLLYEKCPVEDEDVVDNVVAGEEDETDVAAIANVHAKVTATADGDDDGGDDDDTDHDDDKGNRNTKNAKGKGKGKGKDTEKRNKNTPDGSPSAGVAASPPRSSPRSRLLPTVQGFDKERKFDIQIAKDAVQKGQMSLKVRATINGCVVHFPIYVLSGCGTQQGGTGRQTAEIDMILRDHDDAEAQITARTILTLVPTSPKKRKREGSDETPETSPGKKPKRDNGEAAKTSIINRRGKGNNWSGDKKKKKTPPRSSPRTRPPTRAVSEPPSVHAWKTKPYDGPGLDYEETPRDVRGKSKDSDLDSLFNSP
ncbi:hypothetical protein PV08_11314 [Exophiala spinifera]|uniref:USP domain-containing protein n=1 Tax=Exophiala spinifera TaxID=91928 RepID=A0A0D1ZBD7_9EURO|nr:uncharacterized protein PV08_11314 [Exophiala spinifera]KIW10352.1 hypothetical protein PV08_11314 [Exophiala spinifera]